MKKLAMLSLACMLAFPMTVHAEDADRIAALEEKVAALEQRVATLEGGAAPAGVSEVPAQEAVEGNTVETGIELDGCTLEYVDFEVSTDYDDDPCVVVYFDFFNGSGETRNFGSEFFIKSFQHGKEMEYTGVLDNEAYDDIYTDLRSGAGPIRVAQCYKLEDMSEIIVSMNGFISINEDPVEFTLTLE